MEFFNYTKNLIKQKEEEKKEIIYKINPFKQNKNITLIWVDSTKKEKTNKEIQKNTK